MPDTPLKITVKARGTIVVEGAIVVYDEAGNEVPQPPQKHAGIVKLCGCGRSASRPFCDGSHKRQAEEAPAAPARSST